MNLVNFIKLSCQPGGRGGQKSPKFCKRSFWITPATNLVSYYFWGAQDHLWFLLTLLSWLKLSLMNRAPTAIPIFLLVHSTQRFHRFLQVTQFCLQIITEMTDKFYLPSFESDHGFVSEWCAVGCHLQNVSACLKMVSKVSFSKVDTRPSRYSA